MDFLSYRTGKHSCVRSRIGRHLLFIKLLGDPQCFIRTDLEKLGAVILQFREVIKKRWVLGFFFLFYRLHCHIFCRLFCQEADQLPGILLFLETIFFIKERRIKITALFRCLPVTDEASSLDFHIHHHTVKWCFHKIPDLTFSLHYHSKDTGHNTPYGNHCPVSFQEPFDPVSIFQCQCPGKVDTHKVIFLGTQISCRSECIIS